jgi:GT2 family glycosyltransferase
VVGSRVSVIIGAYLAQATIGRCLEALRGQTYRDFEVIVVDSSPDDETARVVSRFPEVRLERSAARLYCHEARNRGVALSGGELLACLDADVCPKADWLETLVATYDRTAQVIVGAIGCHGRGLRHRAFHLCKFSKFLPTGTVRVIDIGPTANLLVARADFERAGGLRGDRYVADVELSRSLQALGRQLTFAGTAVVHHQHTQSVRAFLTERYVRGKIYGRMRSGWLRNRGVIALYLAVSVLPVRLLKIGGHVFSHCLRAGELGTLLLTWPLVLAGHAASVAGESVAYSGALLARAPAEDAEERPGVAVHEPLRQLVEHAQQRTERGLHQRLHETHAGAEER